MKFCVAQLNPQHLFPSVENSQNAAHWNLQFEASCWFRSLSLAYTHFKFIIEYDDAIRRHCGQIDCSSSAYFQECLVSGRQRISGFGAIKRVKLLLESEGPIELLDLSFKSSDEDVLVVSAA